jgi:hypothetical protein
MITEEKWLANFHFHDIMRDQNRKPGPKFLSGRSSASEIIAALTSAVSSLMNERNAAIGSIATMIGIQPFFGDKDVHLKRQSAKHGDCRNSLTT